MFYFFFITLGLVLLVYFSNTCNVVGGTSCDIVFQSLVSSAFLTFFALIGFPSLLLNLGISITSIPYSGKLFFNSLLYEAVITSVFSSPINLFFTFNVGAI